MEPQLSWQPDWRSSGAVRLVLQRSARISHYFQYFFSIVGFIVIASLCAFWLRPQWRDAFSTHLAPFFVAAAEAQDSLEPPFNVADQYSHRLLSGQLETPTSPLFAALADKIPAERIPAEARDDRVMVSAQEKVRVANYLARRYRVALEPMKQLVQVAFQTGHEVNNLDPLLLLAVMAIESSFNPFAESGWGAQGLMQVLSRVHTDKLDYFGGSTAALEPFANIKVGAIVLRDCIVRSGSLAGGLRRYVGSSASGDGGYGARVLAERTRLRQAAHAEV